MMRSPKLRTIVESFRDWGRDYGVRIGYNSKLTDMQAAVGVGQLEKLDGFVATRRHNAGLLRGLLGGMGRLALPAELPAASSSCFRFVF